MTSKAKLLNDKLQAYYETVNFKSIDIDFDEYAPLNIMTKKAYTGVNHRVLVADMIKNNRKSNIYATMKQFGSQNLKLKKGCKGISLLFFKHVQGKDGQQEFKFRYFYVFSIEDTTCETIEFEKVDPQFQQEIPRDEGQDSVTDSLYGGWDVREVPNSMMDKIKSIFMKANDPAVGKAESAIFKNKGEELLKKYGAVLS